MYKNPIITITELKKLVKDELPKNIEQLSIEELKSIYPENQRRKYPKSINILVYWDDVFSIDWGEPECFGCKNLTFSLSGAKDIDQYEETHKGNHNKYKCFDIWNNHFYRCHIIGAGYGGPAQAWNIVYLCDWCHSCLDSVVLGEPKNYYESIKWIKERRKFIVDYMYAATIQYSNYRNIELNLINVNRFIKLSHNENAWNPQYNQHLINKRMNPADAVIASYKYAFDCMAKTPNIIRMTEKEKLRYKLQSI